MNHVFVPLTTSVKEPLQAGSNRLARLSRRGVLPIAVYPHGRRGLMGTYNTFANNSPHTAAACRRVPAEALEASHTSMLKTEGVCLSIN